MAQDAIPNQNQSLFRISSTLAEAFLNEAATTLLSSPTSSSACESPTRRCYLCELPTVLLYSIAQFLTLRDFMSILCCCRRFSKMSANTDLWRLLINKRWVELQFNETETFPWPESSDYRMIARCFLFDVSLHPDRTGEGFIRTTSDIYFGECVKGRCEGRGFKIYFQDRTQYDIFQGEWLADYPHGKGIKKWMNGDWYEGMWKKGYTDGFGAYTWGIGDKYVGHYKDGKRNGEGTYHYADGSTYVGSWFNHKQHGQGKRQYNNGNTYVGEWFEGNLEGFGTFTWQDNSDYHGDVYTGEWKDNTENGVGEYKSSFGTVYSGNYQLGVRQGQGTFSHADGYSWSGTWNGDIPADVNQALHPRMREFILTRKCTSGLTGHTPYYGQVLYRCLDCHGAEDPEKRKYICQNCRDGCHRTHRIEKKIWTCGRSFCWCEPCTGKK